MAKDRIIQRWTTDVTGQGTSAAITVDLGPEARSILIHRFVASHTGGSATAWGPQLLQAASSVDKAFVYATDTDPTSDINDVFAENVPIDTDSSGNLRLEPRFDAGSDNDATFIIYYEIVR